MKKFFILIIILCFFFDSNSFSQWKFVDYGDIYLKVYSLAINGNNIYVGPMGGGNWVSTDNGINWHYYKWGLLNYPILCYAIKDNNIFAGLFGGGVYLSQNNGHTYSIVGGNDLGTHSINSLLINDSNLFAGTSVGAFISSNNGNNWQKINNGFKYLDILSFFYALALGMGKHFKSY